MKSLISFILILLLSNIASTSAFSKNYALFRKNGRQSSIYNEMVSKLTVGDVVSFSNGSSYTVIELPKPGGTTLIVRISKDRALRIPLRSGEFRTVLNTQGTPYWKYIDFFHAGYERLKRFGVQTVQVHDYLPGQFLEVDYVPVRFDLWDFLSGKFRLPDADKAKCLEALYEWAASTMKTTYIGDFNETQVVFDGKRWILIDFTDVVHSLASMMKQSQSKDIPFENIFLSDFLMTRPSENKFFSKAEIDGIYSKMFQTIQNARLNAFQKNCSELLTE
jgi:hypothetical protein